MALKKSLKRTQTNLNESTDFDVDSFDLDLFDQLANPPRKKKSAVIFEELPEEEYEEDEMEEEVEQEDEFMDRIVEEEYEEEEEIVPVRSRMRSVSRAPVRRTSVETVAVRKPVRTGKSHVAVRNTESSRATSRSKPKTLASYQSVDSPESPRSPYGFQVRTTGSPAQAVSPSGISGGWSMSSINGAARPGETPTNPTPVYSVTSGEVTSPVRRKKQNTFIRFCRLVFILGLTIVGCWAIYGVSMESNLGFWKQTFRTEIAFVTETLQSLPVPPLMMIDQP